MERFQKREEGPARFVIKRAACHQRTRRLRVDWTLSMKDKEVERGDSSPPFQNQGGDLGHHQKRGMGLLEANRRPEGRWKKTIQRGCECGGV